MGVEMNWINMLGAAAVMINVGLIVANSIMLLRTARRFRHLLVVDAVLTKLCVDAFVSQHMPIWKPWASSMCESPIEVEIKATRRSWSQLPE